jgi:hypothetical protein
MPGWPINKIIQGRNPCDKRRSIAEYSALFPGIDFSLVCILKLEILKILYLWDKFSI